jgi:hypothetical protein
MFFSAGTSVKRVVLVLVPDLDLWWRCGVGAGSGGVVEWWSGGVVEWWSGGVVEWWSGGVVEWWSGGVVEWWRVQPLGIIQFQRFAL